MKYFFLAEGWTVGRVWSTEGLWDELAWRRSPKIERMSLSIAERSGEVFWLHQAEEAVLMLEVKPLAPTAQSTSSQQHIGQVTLKRLMDADGVIDRLSHAQAFIQLDSQHSLPLQP
jgi:hypothetical protein